MSRKTNFTLLDESITKKMILEMWVEKKPKDAEGRRRMLSSDSHGGGEDMIYMMNGAIYMINQDIFSQNKDTGALSYEINIGMHDKNSEKDQEYTTKEVVNGQTQEVKLKKKVAPRDWLQLKFNLANKDDRKGKWECMDGYSDYSKTSHSLNSYFMNIVDTENNCVLLNDKTRTVIGNSKLTTKVRFQRLFKTMDPNNQDINIEPAM